MPKEGSIFYYISIIQIHTSMIRHFFILLISITAVNGYAQEINKRAEQLALDLRPKMIEWRRNFHENPELSNREFKTAEKIAKHLRGLGIEVQTNVAKTGVVGILKGGKPGPVVALRADIDALPVTERTKVDFASSVTTTFNGMETGVMHACGHDAHMAILMAAAEVLSKIKNDIPGTVKFIFQPAEEGPPNGEEGGAALMVKEGVLKSPDVDVIFGLHIAAGKPIGTISYKPEGIMAASDRFIIKVHGKQAHGSTPWLSVDPIVTATQIITGLQTIVSRQTELTKEAAVISVGMVQAGLRYNIIPEEAVITGTVRTLDKVMQAKIHEQIRLKSTKIAESMGATVDVDIKTLAPLTYNDPTLTEMMIPSLEKAAGKENVRVIKAITGAEDFSVFQQNVPGLYFFVGGQPTGQGLDMGILAGHHTPDFYIDEGGMITGLKAMLELTLDYMQLKK